jgi:hypothetical protein
MPDVDLKFVGRVLAIEPAHIPRSVYKWLVTLSVDRVLVGTFQGKTFSFPVHSPERAGLKAGEQYEVTAVRKGDGYAVVEHKLLR